MKSNPDKNDKLIQTKGGFAYSESEKKALDEYLALLAGGNKAKASVNLSNSNDDGKKPEQIGNKINTQLIPSNTAVNMNQDKPSVNISNNSKNLTPGLGNNLSNVKSNNSNVGKNDLKLDAKEKSLPKLQEVKSTPLIEAINNQEKKDSIIFSVDKFDSITKKFENNIKKENEINSDTNKVLKKDENKTSNQNMNTYTNQNSFLPVNTTNNNSITSRNSLIPSDSTKTQNSNISQPIVKNQAQLNNNVSIFENKLNVTQNQKTNIPGYNQSTVKEISKSLNNSHVTSDITKDDKIKPQEESSIKTESNKENFEATLKSNDIQNKTNHNQSSSITINTNQVEEKFNSKKHEIKREIKSETKINAYKSELCLNTNKSESIDKKLPVEKEDKNLIKQISMATDEVKEKVDNQQIGSSAVGNKEKSNFEISKSKQIIPKVKEHSQKDKTNSEEIKTETNLNRVIESNNEIPNLRDLKGNKENEKANEKLSLIGAKEINLTTSQEQVNVNKDIIDIKPIVSELKENKENLNLLSKSVIPESNDKISIEDTKIHKIQSSILDADNKKENTASIKKQISQETKENKLNPVQNENFMQTNFENSNTNKRQSMLEMMNKLDQKLGGARSSVLVEQQVNNQPINTSASAKNELNKRIEELTKHMTTEDETSKDENVPITLSVPNIPTLPITIPSVPVAPILERVTNFQGTVFNVQAVPAISIPIPPVPKIPAVPKIPGIPQAPSVKLVVSDNSKTQTNATNTKDDGLSLSEQIAKGVLLKKVEKTIDNQDKSEKNNGNNEKRESKANNNMFEEMKKVQLKKLNK